MPTTELCPPESHSWRFKFGLLALLLAAVFAISLTASSQAQAAECTELDACLTAGQWSKAVSDDYNNKAAWFRAVSKQHFIDAYTWNQKAAFAFAAGDGTAAAWYKAVADDYSRKSVAESKAATDYANQALFWAAAADNAFRRYLFMANTVQEIGPAGLTTAKANARLEAAKKICKAKWVNHVCDYVKAKIIDEVLRYVWRMTSGSTCLRQKAQPGYVNPSTGYVERIEHVCTKWA
jgi:hypothetical protein